MHRRSGSLCRVTTPGSRKTPQALVRRLAGLTAAAALLSLALTGCGDSPQSAQQQRSSATVAHSSTSTSGASTTSAETSTTTTSTPRGPLGSGQTVTLAFAGDSSFQGLDAAVRSRPDQVLAAIAPVLGDADLTMVNLEAAVGSGGTPQAKAFRFQTPAQSLDALAAAGVDIVTMANNHGMDYGPEGLASSLQIKAAGPLPIIGIGRDASEAYAPHIFEVKGQRIGFIAANDVFDASLERAWTATDGQPGIASAKGANLERLVASVRATRALVDTLVVYLHYGRETETCPNQRQVSLGTDMFAAGADIVVGSHAHRLQGVGFVGPKLIAYGLGNFIFHPGSAAGRESGVLRVAVTGSRVDSFEWRPAVIQGDVPVPLSGPAAEREATKMADLARCARVADTPTPLAAEQSTTTTTTGGGRP